MLPVRVTSPFLRRSAILGAALTAVLAVACFKVDPSLDVSTKQIDFGSVDEQVTITVRNGSHDKTLASGVTPLEYSVKTDQPWLTVTPTGGRCGEGETVSHVVEVDRALLLLGDNVGVITITSNAGDVLIAVRATRLTPRCSDPPSEPVNPVPALAATEVALDATLRWSEGNSICPENTATYDVYFGNVSPPPFHHNNGSAKSWAPDSLVQGTTYYWRIVARDDNGAHTGKEWKFRTVCAAGPGGITLVGPADGATGVAVDGLLRWGGGNSECNGLSSTYDVYFGTTSPPPFHHNNGDLKLWAPPTMAFATTYYWQIVAKDALGSTAGPVWSFTTGPDLCDALPAPPAAPVPASGTIDAPVTQVLSWSGGTSQCPGLTATYDVYFGTTSTPPFVRDNGSSQAWNPGTLANGTTYYWRVVAKDANGTRSGPLWNFTTATAPCTAGPSAITLVGPADGATGVALDELLRWGGGNSQCAGLSSVYDVYFGTTSPPPFDHANGDSKLWDPGTLAYATTYYWRIEAKDANGTTPGAEWQFTTAAAPCVLPPSAITLTAPANGATNISIQQNLSWSGGVSQCAGLSATYDVYFGTVSPPPFDHDNAAAAAWDPGTLAYATTYYWQIVAKDENGSTAGPVWSFVTEEPCLALPTAPCTPNPTDARTGVNENSNLAWGCGDSQCAGLVATYDVYFGTDETPDVGELVGTTASKTWALPRLQKSTTYYWQIVAKDENGSRPGPVWSFRVRN